MLEVVFFVLVNLNECSQRFRGNGRVGGHHLNHLGFLMAQRHLVAHHLIFNRVLQRRIKQYLDGLSLHEAHLHDTLAEAAVPLHLDYHACFTCLQL